MLARGARSLSHLRQTGDGRQQCAAPRAQADPTDRLAKDSPEREINETLSRISSRSTAP